ncbi:unnamed protein product [Caretta caretta]
MQNLLSQSGPISKCLLSSDSVEVTSDCVRTPEEDTDFVSERVDEEDEGLKEEWEGKIRGADTGGREEE